MKLKKKISIFIVVCCFLYSVFLSANSDLRDQILGFFGQQTNMPNFSMEEIYDLEYSDYLVVEVNSNQPFFEYEEYSDAQAFEEYSDLDWLGRVGPAFVLADETLLPTGDRESITHVYPSGWVQNDYDFVDGKYIYNRSHLIAFSIAGEQDNELNLMTGTRSMNTQGMLPYEMEILEYIKTEQEPVLYRVTPVYEGNNLLASGVLMEAYSLADNGESICFCVYVFNVEDGIEIDYSTGDNWEDVA